MMQTHSIQFDRALRPAHQWARGLRSALLTLGLFGLVLGVSVPEAHANKGKPAATEGSPAKKGEPGAASKGKGAKDKAKSSSKDKGAKDKAKSSSKGKGAKDKGKSSSKGAKDKGKSSSKAGEEEEAEPEAEPSSVKTGAAKKPEAPGTSEEGSSDTQPTSTPKPKPKSTKPKPTKRPKLKQGSQRAKPGQATQEDAAVAKPKKAEEQGAGASGWFLPIGVGLVAFLLGSGLMWVVRRRNPYADEGVAEGTNASEAPADPRVAQHDKALEAHERRLTELEAQAQALAVGEVHRLATEAMTGTRTALEAALRQQQASGGKWSPALQLFEGLRTSGLDVPRLDGHAKALLGEYEQLAKVSTPEPPAITPCETASDVFKLTLSVGKYQAICDGHLQKLRTLPPPELTQKALLDFLGDVIPRLDPGSRHQIAEAQRGLWQGTIELAKLGGLELIYPSLGDTFDSAVHDIVAVEDGTTQASQSVTSITRFGYRAGGSVALKARVKVAR